MPFPPDKKPGGPSPKTEGKGALAALLVGAPASPSSEMEDDHGFEAVAKAFGIPPERQATAQAALKSYIKACMSSSDEEVEEEAY